MKKLLTLFNLLIFVIFCSCSEDTIGVDRTGSLEGTVIDSETELPLDNVKITTSPASTTVFTDENGEFLIENIKVDDYSVKAELENYITGFESVSIIEKELSNVAFELVKSKANNRQPTTPKLLLPEDDATELELTVEFFWKSTDPDEDDLTYELEIKNDSNNEVLKFSEIQDTTYTVENLKYDHKYFWQVKVSDSVNPTVYSEVYSFSTISAPLNNNYLFVREIEGNNVIFSSDSEGNEIQLTSKSNNSFRPRKNLDVNRIAFYRTKGGQTHLFTMKPDGTDQKQVTNAVPANGIDTERLGLSWADNGRYILYPSFDKVYKIQNDGSGREVIYQASQGRYVLDIMESNDKSFFLVLETDLNGYNGSIFKINNAGIKLKTYINSSSGALGGLDISADSNLILYTRDVSGFETTGGRQLNSKIFIYKIDEDRSIEISDDKANGTNDLDPRFAPNDASVIFVNSSNEIGAAKSLYQVFYDENFSTFDYDREILLENAKMPDWE